MQSNIKQPRSFHLYVMRYKRYINKAPCPFYESYHLRQLYPYIDAMEKKYSYLQRTYTRVPIPSRSQKENSKVKHSVICTLTIFSYCTLYYISKLSSCHLYNWIIYSFHLLFIAILLH